MRRREGKEEKIRERREEKGKLEKRRWSWRRGGKLEKRREERQWVETQIESGIIFCFVKRIFAYVEGLETYVN
jgi:hypothetical protein